MKPAALLALTAGALCAQNVQVYSEFAQLTDVGAVLGPENPREILSPAVARNAYSTFQIAIQVPKGTKFLVYVGQNQDDAAKVTFYHAAAGKPGLERIDLPYSGESSQVLWMDLWIDAKAPVRRVKIEPQVGIDGDWTTYPMEVRVMEPVVPDSTGPIAGVASPLEVMHAFLCGTKARPLAGTGSMVLREEMKKTMGGCNAAEHPDPEFYLRLRDDLFTPLWKKVR